MKKSKKAFNLFISSVMIIGLLLLIFIAVKLASVPKTPATVERVEEVLALHNYVSVDTTQKYLDQSSGSSLIKSIGAEKEDIRFQFFEFSNESGALDAYRKFHSLIIRTRNSSARVETKNKMANYSTYTLRTDSLYSVAIYVGPTVVYAESNSDNAVEINQILFAIDYLKEGTFKSNAVFESSVIVFFTILLLFMTWLSCRWLWLIVCNSAGVTKQEVRNYRKKNNSKFFINKKTYLWLVHRSNNSSKFKWLFAVYQLLMTPSRICIGVAVAGYFIQSLNYTINLLMVTGIGISIIMGIANVIYNKIVEKKLKN